MKCLSWSLIVFALIAVGPLAADITIKSIPTITESGDYKDLPTADVIDRALSTKENNQDYLVGNSSRRVAIEELANREGDDVTGALKKIFETEKSELRVQAAAALIEKQPELVQGFLVNTLDDPSETNVAVAAEALSRIGDFSGVPASAKLVGYSNPRVSNPSFKVIKRQGDPEVTRSVIDSLLTLKSDQHNTYAVHLAGTLSGTKAIAILRPLMKHESSLVRSEVINTIAGYRTWEAVCFLVENLKGAAPSDDGILHKALVKTTGIDHEAEPAQYPISENYYKLFWRLWLRENIKGHSLLETLPEKATTR